MKKLCTYIVATSIAISSFSTLASENIARLQEAKAARTELYASNPSELKDYVLSEFGPLALKRMEKAAQDGEDLHSVASQLVTGSEFIGNYCSLTGGRMGFYMFGVGALVLVATGLNKMKPNARAGEKADVNRDADSLVSTINNEIVQLRAEGVREDSYLITTRKEEIKQTNIYRNARIGEIERSEEQTIAKGQKNVAIGAVAGVAALMSLQCRY